MPLVVSLLTELGLVGEGIAAIIAAISGALAIMHAFKFIKAAVASRRA